MFIRHDKIERQQSWTNSLPEMLKLDSEEI